MLEPVWTFGGVVIAALVSAMALILVAKINVVTKKVDTTIDQTAATGNGYVDRSTKATNEIRESLRQLHRRMDAQDTHAARRNDHLDGVLTKFDDRLTHIEEKL